MRKLVNRLAEHIAIIERRTGKRISNRQIAKEAGVSKVTVDAYVRNDRDAYSTTVVFAICEYLGIDPTTEFWAIEEIEDGEAEEEESELPVAV